MRNIYIFILGVGASNRVAAENYALREERGLFLVPAFIKSGDQVRYQDAGNFTSAPLLLDTLNRQSYLFGHPSSCRNCPRNYVSLAPGAFHALPGQGKV